MKVLNLYCGLGGNRKLWEDVMVDAVDNDKAILDNYRKTFPDDYGWLMDAP